MRTVLSRPRLAAVLVAVLAAAPATAYAVDAPTLERRLAEESRKLGAASGALVVDLDAGRELFARREDRPRIPASNQKLLTTAAALLRFGPDAVLETTLRLAPGTRIVRGTVGGDVFLVGGGDPALDDRDLRDMAAQLAEAGITRIRGGVVGDESLFDARRGGPRTGFRADSDLGGWLGALAWGHGRAWPDGPAVVAANRLQLFLKQAGITVGRKARAGVLQDAPAGGGTAAQDDGTAAGLILARTISPTMRQLAAITNQPSDNFYAEMLVKGLGARFGKAGSTAAGLAVVRAELVRFGIHPRLADGSGLSRANRVTPRQLVRLLERMANQQIAPSWTASLARFGSTGTLVRRLRGTAAARRCAAKTGTINRVSALSGYCTARSGARIAFSFLENGVNPLAAKRIEDRMVRVIATYDG
ncbi:MAG TPA: D-alanyl-D-alanine carboxypeptidase/D-alanyl-D-alanine-endopeptidase [Baekduia sp.]|nr:D-alanyl-D-alanine carboxypeptidase/D-alanyl-D-alanine-endopeptidase [Baekduia sp.]